MNLQTTIRMHDGVEIPQLGLGVWQTPQGQVTIDAVKWALQAGVRHIDTAAIYRNEEGVGEAIRQSGINRDELFITTKLWNEDVRQSNSHNACLTSLEKLGLDYVDLYLIHWPATGFEKAWLAMESLKREGKVRSIGVSNFHANHLERLFNICNEKPTINQIELHPHLTQEPLREFCAQHDILVEAWSPLGGGRLLDHPELVQIAQTYEKTVAQIIIRWDLQHGMVTIPKSVHKDRIISNTQVFDFELSSEDMAKIDGLNQNARTGGDPDNFNF